MLLQSPFATPLAVDDAECEEGEEAAAGAVAAAAATSDFALVHSAARESKACVRRFSFKGCTSEVTAGSESTYKK